MKTPIRVLGIAPYEGLKSLMSSLVEEYTEADFTFFVGNLQKGVEIAKSNFHANFDVIISRGGTAKMIQEIIPLPVVEIDVSFYDVLCAVKLADSMDGPIAMVAFSNITTNAQMLCSLLNYDIDIVTIEHADEVEPTLQQLQKKGYRAILCDVIAATTAKKLGLNAFLVTSGADSLRLAFERAIQLCHSQARLRDENRFLREIIRGQIGHTVVFDAAGELFFSSSENPSDQVLEMLRKEIPDTRADCERRILRTISGMLYSIRAQRMASGELEYVAFFFSVGKTPFVSNQCGINFYSCHESEERFFQSIFSIIGTVNDLQQDLTRINQSASPVMVAGEDGTGKEQVVSILYTRGPLRNNPLVSVNCSLVNDKSWQFLIEHHNSPLAGADNVIYFSNIDTLPDERQRQLLAALSEMEACKRNRILFSCVCQQGESMSATGMQYVNALSCITLYLPPLRGRPDRIPPLVNLYLNHLNMDLTKPILSVEPEGQELLAGYQWPYNYTQFKRVIKELAVTAAGPVITTGDVRGVLEKEKTAATFSLRSENAAQPLDLNRTLDEITQDIVYRVLEETGGNQTMAAKKLGISRTTLWRLVRAK